jgi:predicted ATP-grasp superfamily ATP-dependent carboligase
MKILIAEYTMAHDPALAPEGRAMVRTLVESFQRTGFDVVMPEPGGDFGDEIRRLAPECNEALVIAPDQILARYTKIVEDLSRNIGCNSLSIALCANKRRTAETLKMHGIDVPAEVHSGMRVIKEISGCGALHMRYRDEEPGEKELGQEFIDGEHFSVSLVGGRVVGEVCLYYSGAGPLVLALNRQYIRIDEDGLFHYEGGETPASHPRRDEIISIAQKAATVLGCQGYTGVDLVVSQDRIVVVDVNPRPTDSIIGIAAIMEEEIADIILKSSYGKIPEQVTLKGKAVFGKNGEVTVCDRD